MARVCFFANNLTLTYCHVSSNCVYRRPELLVGVSGWLLVSYKSARLEESGLV